MNRIVLPLIFAFFLYSLANAQSEADVNEIQQLIQKINDYSQLSDKALTDENFDLADDYALKIDEVLKRFIQIMKKLAPEMASSYDEMLKEFEADERELKERINQSRSSQNQNSNTNSARPDGYSKTSSTNGNDVKSESEKISKLKTKLVVERKQQAAGDKREIQNRIVSQIQATEKNNCIAPGLSINLSSTPESGILNPNSLNSSVSWSVWKQIPGTALEIRFSKKKVCAEPEFPNTTDREKNLQYVLEGADQFFDYGFLQLRNRSNQTVSGQLLLVTQGDNTTHSEDWPFYLEPGKTGEESIGNWYMGCEISSVTVKRYCK